MTTESKPKPRKTYIGRNRTLRREALEQAACIHPTVMFEFWEVGIQPFTLDYYSTACVNDTDAHILSRLTSPNPSCKCHGFSSDLPLGHPALRRRYAESLERLVKVGIFEKRKVYSQVPGGWVWMPINSYHLAGHADSDLKALQASYRAFTTRHLPISPDSFQSAHNRHLPPSTGTIRNAFPFVAGARPG